MKPKKLFPKEHWRRLLKDLKLYSVSEQTILKNFSNHCRIREYFVGAAVIEEISSKLCLKHLQLETLFVHLFPKVGIFHLESFSKVHGEIKIVLKCISPEKGLKSQLKYYPGQLNQSFEMKLKSLEQKNVSIRFYKSLKESIQENLDIQSTHLETDEDKKHSRQIEKEYEIIKTNDFRMTDAYADDPVAEALQETRGKLNAIYFPRFLKAVVKFAQMNHQDLVKFVFIDLCYANIENLLELLHREKLTRMKELMRNLYSTWKSKKETVDEKFFLFFPMILFPAINLQRHMRKYFLMREKELQIQSKGWYESTLLSFQNLISLENPEFSLNVKHLENDSQYQKEIYNKAADVIGYNLVYPISDEVTRRNLVQEYMK